MVLTVPRAAHQRTTTYELFSGKPTRIDLTTVYPTPQYLRLRPSKNATPAMTGFAFTQARQAEAELSAYRMSRWSLRMPELSSHEVPLRSPESTRPDNTLSALPPDPVPKTQLTLKTQGLIRVTGNHMTYIVSNPGGPRPASFDTTPGDVLTKVTLTRIR